VTRVARCNQHPPRPADLPALWEIRRAYRPKALSRQQQIVSVAEPHDSCGFTRSLTERTCDSSMSHAMLRKLRIGSSLWSVARDSTRADRIVTVCPRPTPSRNFAGRAGRTLARDIEGILSKFFLETVHRSDQLHERAAQPSDCSAGFQLYVMTKSPPTMPARCVPITPQAFRAA